MTETGAIDTWNQIRVKARVVKYWKEKGAAFDNVLPNGMSQRGVYPTLLFCGLDDGRVYQSVKTGDGREWVLHTPAMEDR